MRCLTYRPWRSLTARQLSHGLRSKIVNRGQIKIRSSRKGSLGSSVQPWAIQPINVRKESARGIRSQTPRNNCEEVLSDSTAQTTKNSDENAKVRLQTRIYYKPGRELVLPDMLSCAPCCPETTDINNIDMEQETALHVHLVQSSLPVSKPKLEEIREEITKDESRKDLSEIIKHGWPETKACLCKSTCLVF